MSCKHIVPSFFPTLCAIHGTHWLSILFIVVCLCQFPISHFIPSLLFPCFASILYLDKTIIPKDTCTSVFLAALFTIARTWKQRRYPQTEEWIKKMWYIYTMEYYSPKKEQNRALCRDMNYFLGLYKGWLQLRLAFLVCIKDGYH